MYGSKHENNNNNNHDENANIVKALAGTHSVASMSIVSLVYQFVYASLSSYCTFMTSDAFLPFIMNQADGE